jgi:hypothetical protein
MCMCIYICVAGSTGSMYYSNSSSTSGQSTHSGRDHLKEQSNVNTKDSYGNIKDSYGNIKKADEPPPYSAINE